MNSAKAPPVLSMLSAARDIFNSRRIFRFIFLFTFLAGLFILIESIFFVVFVFSNDVLVKAVSLDIDITTILVLGLPLLLITPFIIFHSRTSVKMFESFVSSFYPIFLRTEVDLFISTSENISESVVSLIKTIDKDLERAKVNPPLSKRAGALAHSFDITLKAKKKIAAVVVMKESNSHNETVIKELQSNAKELRRALRKNFCMLIIVNTDQSDLKDTDLGNSSKLRTIILKKTSNGFRLDYLSQ